MSPVRLDLRPDRPDLRPDRPDLRPDKPDLRPDKPDLRPDRLDWLVGGGRINERTNIRKSPCVLQDFVPFGAAAQKR